MANNNESKVYVTPQLTKVWTNHDPKVRGARPFPDDAAANKFIDDERKKRKQR